MGLNNDQTRDMKRISVVVLWDGGSLLARDAKAHSGSGVASAATLWRMSVRQQSQKYSSVNEGIAMRPIKWLASVAVISLMFACAHAQEVNCNYDLGANFASYKTYQWVDLPGPGAAEAGQLIDQVIKRAVDEQLVQKGLVKVESDGDLRIGYEAVIDPGRTITFVGTESLAWGWGNAIVQGETSTISIGMVWIDLYDPGRKQLVWRGDARRAIDLKKDSHKNYKSVKKCMVKLFKNYPPES